MNAKAEVVNVFQLTEIADTSDEVIEADEGYTEDTGLSSHGLAVAYVERCKRHHAVHIQRIDLDVVRVTI